VLVLEDQCISQLLLLLLLLVYWWGGWMSDSDHWRQSVMKHSATLWGSSMASQHSFLLCCLRRQAWRASMKDGNSVPHSVLPVCLSGWKSKCCCCCCPN
jgi:hypothetical protein